MKLLDYAPYVRTVRLVRWELHNGKKRYIYDSRFLYILDGEVDIEINDRRAVLRPGSLLFTPAGYPLIFVRCETVLEYYITWFDFDFSHADGERYHGNVLDVDFDPEKITGRDPRGIFTEPVIVENAYRWQRYFQDIYDEFTRREKYFEDRMSALVLLALTDLLRETEVKNSASAKTTDALISYISEHYFEKLTGKQLSDRFFYHPYYLSQLIKERTGLPLHQYILRCRVDEAFRLLTSTSLPLEEIAVRTGFATPSHFSECFRKAVGRPPSDLRR